VLRRLAVLLALAIAAPLPLAGAVPPVQATAYIVVNPVTGETLAQRAPDRELPMASTTKIMTALIVLERADLDQVLNVPPAAVTVGGSTGHLVAGEGVSVRNLLTALLVASGNDAAVTLAQGVAGSQERFVDLMNRKARELGLTETHFSNPHGLDAPGHHSSVRDLVTLAQVAMRDPLFRRTVASRRATIPGPGGVGVRRLESENLLLDVDPEADGVKTGMTDGAGYALVGHARRKALGMELYTAVIGAPSAQARARDGRLLLDWGFSRYARAALVGEGAVYGRAPVQGRPGTSVPYVAAGAVNAPIRLGGPPVTETIAAPRQLAPPVRAGQVLGSVTVRQGATVLGRRDLVAATGAGGPSLWDRVRSGFEALVP
jgi:D-alanyl-D-alanine carboxypeptidase (penicillin-binding protein 5/6)